MNKFDGVKTIVIFGAFGRVGRHLTATAVNQGHKVIAAVRRPEDIEEYFSKGDCESIEVRKVDSLNPQEVREAMIGADVAINVSGSFDMGDSFVKIVDIFVEQAELHLKEPKRVWLFAGLAALNFPESQFKAIDLPILGNKFEAHGKNLVRLQRSKLDWVLVCPGPLKDVEIANKNKLCLSIDDMPFELNKVWKALPKSLWLLPFIKNLPLATISYQDVAEIVFQNLLREDIGERRIGIGVEKGTEDLGGMLVEIGNRLKR